MAYTLSLLLEGNRSETFAIPVAIDVQKFLKRSAT